MASLPCPALRCLAPLAAALALGAISCGGAQDGQTTTPAKPEADEPAQKDDDTATIDAYCTPAVPVLIDGKPAGTAPLKGVKVTPGSHDVTCVDETGNRTLGVTVAAGESKAVINDRPINAGKR